MVTVGSKKKVSGSVGDAEVIGRCHMRCTLWEPYLSALVGSSVRGGSKLRTPRCPTGRGVFLRLWGVAPRTSSSSAPLHLTCSQPRPIPTHTRQPPPTAPPPNPRPFPPPPHTPHRPHTPPPGPPPPTPPVAPSQPLRMRGLLIRFSDAGPVPHRSC